MLIRAAGKTDVGCLREKNEDAFHVDVHNGLFIVCDGMGGHAAGEVASRKTIEFVSQFIANARRQRKLPTRDDENFRQVWGELVVEAIERCCDSLVSFAKTHPEFEGMATTITALLIVEGVAFVGHLGDSRLYLKNRDVAKQLTRDHTMFEEYADANPEWVEANNDLKSLKRFQHVLTRCVGREQKFKVENFSFHLADDDVILLCSDGLSNYFHSDDVIVEFLEQEDSAVAVDSLIAFAKSRGGSDNISAIVVRASNEAATLDDFTLDPGLENSATSDTDEWVSDAAG
ncbi:PP2C family protein-serine/threonine phosphatase [Mariniblastus fucicola]|uniref:Serine/threonine phosphatase stp n=1 Tax=Mariniblastus fucicola TaxID=980251 RepID=A0A5B9PF22_9BACT|nr:protein phosphatase 2C domain-containing protein [Mariniblastus fucicola]QEG23795.1 Serine/threonine phosphatase stp [Mariniblastus fucicola]